MSGRCTKKGAGISSQLVTAFGNNMKISLDKPEWKKLPESGLSTSSEMKILFYTSYATFLKGDIF